MKTKLNVIIEISLGKIREKVSSKAAYFHLVSWSIPLVLTITCMALAQVEFYFKQGIYSMCERLFIYFQRRSKHKVLTEFVSWPTAKWCGLVSFWPL